MQSPKKQTQKGKAPPPKSLKSALLIITKLQEELSEKQRSVKYFKKQAETLLWQRNEYFEVTMYAFTREKSLLRIIQCLTKGEQWKPLYKEINDSIKPPIHLN